MMYTRRMGKIENGHFVSVRITADGQRYTVETPLGVDCPECYIPGKVACGIEQDGKIMYLYVTPEAMELVEQQMRILLA